MPIIKILPHAEYCPQGAEVSAPAGTSICEALLENGIKIEEVSLALEPLRHHQVVVAGDLKQR